MNAWSTGAWQKGVVEWIEGEVAFLSVVFSWDVDEAYARAVWLRQAGYSVRVGGPGVFTAKRAREFDGIAVVGGSIPGTQRRHNPMSTKASEGCPVGCSFCIVPAMEGRTFTLFPDFDPRPVLTDNNLSALPADFQRLIVERFRAAEVPLLDANSGFEPKTFDDEVYRRWAPINRGPWRFGLDESNETDDVERVIRMLRREGVAAKRIRPYVMIGNEPVEACLERIYRVIAWGGEPYVQPIMKLTAARREPWVRYDWTSRKLKAVQRWANGRFWRKAPRFEDYDVSVRNGREREPDRLLLL